MKDLFDRISRAFRGRPWALVAVLWCLYRAIGLVTRTLLDALVPVESDLPILRLVEGPAVAGFAVACAIAAARGRRVAVQCAAWAVLFELLILGRWRLVENPMSLLPLLIWAGVLWMLHRRIPREWGGAPSLSLAARKARRFTLPRVSLARFARCAPTARPTGRVEAGSDPQPRKDLVTGLKLTIALFVGLEALAGLTIRNFYQEVLDPPTPVVNRPPAYQAGLPTFATIGSSPANVERLNDRPFSRVLSERYSGRFNFLFYRAGGLSSYRLVAIARDLMEAEQPPDALILYMGHQDLNASRGAAFLRNLDLLGSGEWIVMVVKTLVHESALVRFSLYGLWRHRYDHLEVRDPRWVEEVFRSWSANVTWIIEEARRRGIAVFAVTAAADRSRISEASQTYLALENNFLRGLPSRYSHVVLVDFEPVLDARYPDGPRPDCEPFEPDPVRGGCGDPYHLGPRGHEILADLLGPALERWVRDREPRR